MKIARIVSGGQTGADRAALDWAIEHEVAHGGWCPAGRRAEDGTIPARYSLEALPEGGGYRRRTKANVRDSDATLIVSIEPVLTGGSRQPERSPSVWPSRGCICTPAWIGEPRCMLGSVPR